MNYILFHVPCNAADRRNYFVTFQVHKFQYPNYWGSTLAIWKSCSNPNSVIFPRSCIVLIYFFLMCCHDCVTYVDPSELEMLLRLLAPTSPVVKFLEGRWWLVEGATKGLLWHRSGGTTSCDRWKLLLLGELRFLVPPSAGTKIHNQQNNNINKLMCFLNKQNS